MKNATAISQGTRRLLEAVSGGGEDGASIGPGGLVFVGLGCIGLRDRVSCFSRRDKPIIAEPSFDFVEPVWGFGFGTIVRRR
jgi:hypothetical protein